MPLRPCLGWRGQRCTRLTGRPGSRCEEHGRLAEAARRPDRPSARQRGYDAEHDATRARLLPLAYGTACPRCGQPMLADQALDLGHTVARSVDPTARGDRVEHAHCNRAAGSS